MRLSCADYEFPCNIVKVQLIVDPWDNTIVDPQATFTFTMLWPNSLSMTEQMHEKLTSIFFFFYSNDIT